MVALILTFFERQIREIEKDLKWFGIALGFIHMLTAYFWWGNTYVILRHVGICWSFFPYCEPYQQFFNDYVDFFYPFYLGLGFSIILSFALKRVKWGYFLLIFASLFQAAVQISDYRFSGNYHYMHHVVTFVFLLMPEKSMMIRFCLVLFYFFAGFLKFDLEWLSGAALINPVRWVPRWLMDWMLIFVIYLEVLLAWFLLSRRWYFKYSVLVSYILFHVFSYFVVGYFYPLLMLSLLTVFLVDRQDFQWPRSWLNWGLVIILSLANLYPHVFERQSALHGRGRLLSLNMLDAMTHCRNIFYIRFKDRTLEYIRDPLARDVRGRCDYTTVFDKAKELCREFQGQPEFEGINMSHQVRKATEEIFSHQIQFKNICGRPLKISWWGDLYQEGNGPSEP